MVGNLHYEVLLPEQPSRGSVLLSSGLGGSGGYWMLQVGALLAAGWRVIVYDQAGTGQSPAQLHASYAIDDMAQDVRHILNATQTTSCHFVGHALGGLVGLLLAIESPEHIASLTLINAWASPNPHSARCFDARLTLLDLAGPTAYVAAQPIFLYPASWVLEHHEEVEAEVIHGVAHFQGVNNLKARIAALRAFDVQDRLGKVSCPVLVSAAQDDVLVPWQQSHALVEGIERALAHFVPTGAHAHNITHADAFNLQMLGFLEQQVAAIGA